MAKMGVVIRFRDHNGRFAKYPALLHQTHLTSYLSTGYVVQHMNYFLHQGCTGAAPSRLRQALTRNRKDAMKPEFLKHAKPFEPKLPFAMTSLERTTASVRTTVQETVQGHEYPVST